MDIVLLQLNAGYGLHRVFFPGAPHPQPPRRDAISGFAGYIIIAALIFSKVYTGLGATAMIKNLVLNMGAEPLVVMVCIQLSFFILGMFMDDITILFMCMPIYIPIIVGLGLDPVWFGIFFVVNM